MYDLINQHYATILQRIGVEHVVKYEWLLANRANAKDTEFQRRYRDFWAMNAAQLSQKFYDSYFQRLQQSMQFPVVVGDLARQLYKIHTHGNGRQSLQFSFVTKLAHMANQCIPIYDSLVAAFYFYREPSVSTKVTPAEKLSRRIVSLVGFHDFLVREYQRVITQKLLAASIQAFRNQFNPQHFTNEKIIDSLIWGYVSLLRSGGIMTGSVQYH